MSENIAEKSMQRPQIKSVYHSLESVLNVLKAEESKALPEVEHLIKLFDSKCSEKNVDSQITQANRKPFVVFEGLDGSGKTSVSRRVVDAVGGVVKRTPPECMVPLREKFDTRPMIIRRAYYGLGNYIAAMEIQNICQESPVFVDRFWHSTTAYALAHEFKDGGGIDALPQAGDPVYDWPHDLLRPDLVIFLTVDEEQRKIRHDRRCNRTEEEEQLKDDQTFRELVLAAYKCMNDPPVVYVDSSQNIKRTVSQCVKHIQKLPVKV